MIDTYFAEASAEYGSDLIRAAFQSLDKSRTKINADSLRQAFESSQREVRLQLEEKHYPAFIDSENYRHGYLPSIDEHKVGVLVLLEFSDIKETVPLTVDFLFVKLNMQMFR